LRDGISLDEKSKTKEKEKNRRKRLMDAISLDEKSQTKEKEKNRRKRLRLAKNDTPSISPHDCMKEAKKYLHRSQDLENPHKHKSIVCVICN
jgi:hypothetical protein